jgi:hypothetical protein
MFLIDDILLSPMHGFFWLAKQIHNAVEKETIITPEQITAELSDLYMMLDIGQIEAEEFDRREAELLDLLDELQNAAADAEAGEDEDDEDDFDEEDDDDIDEDEFDDDFETDEEDENESFGEDESASENEFIGKDGKQNFGNTDDAPILDVDGDWEN